MLESGIYVPTLGCHSKMHKPSEARQLKRGAKLQSQVISEPCSLEESMGGAPLPSSRFQQIKAICGSLGPAAAVTHCLWANGVCSPVCLWTHDSLPPVCFRLLHCEGTSDVGEPCFSLAHYTCSGPTSKEDHIFRHWKGHGFCIVQSSTDAKKVDRETER